MDLYTVTCYKLAPELWNVPVTDRYPLGATTEEAIRAELATLDFSSPKTLRHTAYLLGLKLQKMTIEKLFKRDELFGTFTTFEEAEHFVLHRVSCWEDGGSYNLACIRKLKSGVSYSQTSFKDETFWYTHAPIEGTNCFVGKPIEHPKRFEGHLFWTMPVAIEHNQ